MLESTKNDGATKMEELAVYRASPVIRKSLNAIGALLGSTQGQECLVVYGGDHATCRLLRERGGAWQGLRLGGVPVVADDPETGDGQPLPFADGQFDSVVLIDVLEQLGNDYQLIAECHRVLKPAGQLVLRVANARKGLLAPASRHSNEAGDNLLRPGYTRSQLFDLLKDGFDVPETHAYSRFLFEAVRLLARKLAPQSESPLSWRLARREASLTPLFWLADRLDLFLPLSRGYLIAVQAKRRQWIPRRRPVLADGRSIAEAALQSKIGTAAPF